MYNSEASATATSGDATYTVAHILSRLSDGEAITPSYGEAPVIPGISYVSTGTTPTLTPTTIANIEQSFIELSSLAPTSTTNTASAAVNAQDLSRQSGFVPPVINPGVKSEYYYSDDYENDSEDADWMPPGSKRMRGADGKVIEITPNSSPASNASPGPRRHTGPRPRKNEILTPEEEAKRNLRRERNKLAAAKCRQRRVDHTNKLINETENLEEEKATLENEIQTLQQQKEQLEFLLKAHKPMCSAKLHGHAIANSTVVVKAEPAESGLTRPNSLPLVITTAGPITATRTIPIATSANVTEATGIAISTPSTGVFNTSIGLEIMADGHTGLTPLTTGPTCASQVQRNSSDSSPQSDALASPTLMAL